MASGIDVLHVDDEPPILDLTKEFLERDDKPFTVETATGADEGLNIVSDTQPDCIISDYNMPGMDGIEFLNAVRAEYPALPFILFTGKGSEEVASNAIAAGVTDYLQKGGGLEQYELLANRIRNAVHARRRQEQAERQEQLMRLTEFAGDTGGFELDVQTGETLITDGTKRILNISEQEDSNFEENLQYYHPDDREQIQQAIQQALDTGEQTCGTWRYQHPDRDEQQLLNITYVPAEVNGCETVRGAVHDVTDRRDRQRELHLLQQAIDDANVAITLADTSQPDKPLVYVNDAFEEMTGYPPEETIGRNCRFLQGEDTNPEKVAALREAIDGEETISVDLRNYRKNGTEFWNRLTVTPIYNDNGNLVRYLGNQRDITEQKERERKLESERQFIEQALDTIEHMFYVIDTAGTIQRWNRKALDVTGHDESELDGMPAIELFPEEERDKVAEAVATTLADGDTTVQADIRSADGERLPYEFSGARLTDDDGEPTGLVGIGRELNRTP